MSHPLVMLSGKYIMISLLSRYLACLQNDLLRVKWDTKLYSHSLTKWSRSTTTIVITLFRTVCSLLSADIYVNVYSVELSKAFDTFVNELMDKGTNATARQCL